MLAKLAAKLAAKLSLMVSLLPALAVAAPLPPGKPNQQIAEAVREVSPQWPKTTSPA